MKDNPIIILGAKGIGKVALEIFKSTNREVFCFLDDDASLKNQQIGEVSILGTTDEEEFIKLIGKSCDVFVATDDSKLHAALVDKIIEERKVMPVNAIHQLAYISSYASIGYGNFINAASIINAGAEIQNNCLIHTGVLIEYDVIIENKVQIGAGTTVGAGCKIETGAFVGSGSTLVAGITIGKNARIGAGSLVIADVKSNQTVFGNPAKPI